METALIQDKLIECGLPPHILGFSYLTDAVQMYQPRVGILGEIYVDISRKYHTTPNRVERDIRHGIELLFQRGDLAALHRIFGGISIGETGRPSNLGFISTMRFRLEQEKESLLRAATQGRQGKIKTIVIIYQVKKGCQCEST